MTDNEMNRRIAEACGAEPFYEIAADCWSLIFPDGKCGPNVKGGLSAEHCWRVCCPNYCGDLNAIAEAEELFEAKTVDDLNKPDRMFLYTSHLARICVGHFGGQTRATARQRAEAFLKTIGKWEEPK